MTQHDNILAHWGPPENRNFSHLSTLGTPQDPARGRDYYLRSLAINCVNAVLNAVYAVYILRFESVVYYAVYISLYQFLRSLRSLFTQFLRSLRSLFTQFTPGNPKKYTRLETQYTQKFSETA